jgi:hypothetical protein
VDSKIILGFGAKLIATVNNKRTVKKRGGFATYLTYCTQCKSEIRFIPIWSSQSSMNNWLKKESGRGNNGNQYR